MKKLALVLLVLILSTMFLACSNPANGGGGSSSGYLGRYHRVTENGSLSERYYIDVMKDSISGSYFNSTTRESRINGNEIYVTHPTNGEYFFGKFDGKSLNIHTGEEYRKK